MLLAVANVIKRTARVGHSASVHPLLQQTRSFSTTTTPAIPALRCDSKWAETPFATRVFSALQLSEFSEDELHAAFDRADLKGDSVRGNSVVGVGDCALRSFPVEIPR
jgi:hypothetical protein